MTKDLTKTSEDSNESTSENDFVDRFLKKLEALEERDRIPALEDQIRLIRYRSLRDNIPFPQVLRRAAHLERLAKAGSLKTSTLDLIDSVAKGLHIMAKYNFPDTILRDRTEQLRDLRQLAASAVEPSETTSFAFLKHWVDFYARELHNAYLKSQHGGRQGTRKRAATTNTSSSLRDAIRFLKKDTKKNGIPFDQVQRRVNQFRALQLFSWERPTTRLDMRKLEFVDDLAEDMLTYHKENLPPEIPAERAEQIHQIDSLTKTHSTPWASRDKLLHGLDNLANYLEHYRKTTKSLARFNEAVNLADQSLDEVLD